MSESNESPRLSIWREITILSVMVMDVSWSVPWLQTISPPLRAVATLHTFLVLLAILVISYWLTKIASIVNLKRQIYQWMIVGWAIFVSWISIRVILSGLGSTQFSDFLAQPVEEVRASGRLIPPEVWILGVTLLLIWRGTFLVQSWAGRETVFTSLVWGLGLFSGYGVLSAINHQPVPLWLIYTFVSAALFAMVSARVSSLEKMRGGSHSPFDTRWMATMIGAALAVTVVAALLSGFMARQIERINELLRLAFYGLVSLLILPIIYLLKLGEPVIQAVENMMPTPTPAPQIPLYEQGLEEAPVYQTLEEVASTGGVLLDALYPILIGIVIVGLVYLVFRLYGNRKIRQDKQSPDDRESLLEGKSLWNMLIGSLRNRILGIAEDLSGGSRLRRRARLQAAARIRRIYTEMMDLCEELGQPRPSAITPLEFLPVTEQVFPQQRDDLIEITESYVRVRYGELPETNREVYLVEEAWKRVYEQGMIIKKQAQARRKR